MALSATFTANFASFYDAVDKADAKLKDFGEGADKVGARLDRLSNQFSGRQIVQEATIMAKAVEEIGGVSKLTEKELARLGATTNEAVAKMKALGLDVPEHLQRIADQTKYANKAAVDWMGTLTKVASTIGIAFSVDKIVSFVGSVFDAAGAVKDLSEQWGVSTKAVQQWSTAAKASGVDAEKLGKSIQFMTGQLSEGSKEYNALLKNLGLSGDALRGMGTEAAFREMVKAIAAVEDETLQLDLAISAFGPNAKQIIGAIRDGFLDAADAADYMGDETIARLEAAGDAWEALKNKVVIVTGEMIAAVMSATETMGKSWGTFFKTIGLSIKDAVTGGASASAFLTAQAAADDYAASLRTTAAATDAANTAGQAHQGTLKTTAQVLADVKAKEEAFKKAQQEREKATAAAKKAQDDYNRSIQAQRDHIIDIMEAFEGTDIKRKAFEYLQALEHGIPIQKMTAQQQEHINKTMREALDVFRAAGEQAPREFEEIYLATLKVDQTVEQFLEHMREIGRGQWMKAMTGQAFDPAALYGSTALTGAPPKPGMFDGMAAGIVGAMSASILKAIQGGGDLLQAAGSALGMTLLDPKGGFGKAIEAQTKKLPNFLGGAITSALPVVGALIGPAVSWLGNKIAGLFGKKEHEKLRESFIQSFGSIEKLSDQARIAGFSLDKLFAARNTDQVKKAIDEINAAIGLQADAYGVVMEAAQRYGFTLEELGPALARQELDKQAQQLFKDWQVLNSAGIDTVAITEKMSEAISTYVQDAMAMGSEIPAAMRPMLDAMAKSGQLLDQNGEAITDLEDAGLSFTLTMSEGFKGLIDEVKKLTDAIARSLGIAIRNVPDVEVRGTVVWDVPPVPGVSQPQASAPGPEFESYQHGTDGFRNFGTGTPVMLHGWEAVVPRETSDAFATVGTGFGPSTATAGPPMTINLVQDGRVTARVVARYLPDAVKEFKV